MEEEIVTQIGLLLSQLRYARRALEDIERSTAHYGGVTFAVALAAGPRFGEPPLLSGALKVYVTNISDLTIARGSVGLIEGIMGGIGRFIGGLTGGLVGGVIGGVALWVWVGKLQEIVKGINEILDRLGIRGGAAAAKPEDKGKAEGSDWVAALERLKPMLDSFTALFDAAARGPEAAGKSAAENLSEEARSWSDRLATLLPAATEMLTALDKVIKGLTIFIPVLIGALASLLVRLDDIKLAILDLLQFALRVVLLLRGAALVTIYDTIAAAAKLGASILGILKDAVKTILEAILAILGKVFSTVEAFIRFIGTGLKNVMDGLLQWLVNGLGRVLTYIGDLRIFRLLVHLVQVLPSMLPALVALARGNDVTITPQGMQWLDDIRNKQLPRAIGPTAASKLLSEAKFPDIGETLLKDVAPFKKSLEETTDLLPKKTEEAFKAAQTGLIGIDKKMQEALTTGEANFQDKLSKDLKNVTTQVQDRAKELAPAAKTIEDQAKAETPDGGLSDIAKAYQDWLKSNGLKAVLEQITGYFASANVSEAPAGATALPSATINTARPEPPKATVEIGELIIDLKPGKPDATTKPQASKPLGMWRENLPPDYDEMAERYA